MMLKIIIRYSQKILNANSETARYCFLLKVSYGKLLTIREVYLGSIDQRDSLQEQP